jgi:S1-C subfamily serine protease
MRPGGSRIVAAALRAAVLFAVSLWVSPSFAQDSGSSSAAPPPPPPPPQQGQQPSRDLEAKLAQARQRLEQAARQVAELSAQLGADARNRAFAIQERFDHGMIGLQLDPASGPDGARVLDVSPGGPAEEAGVRAGDVIIAVNDASIAGKNTARMLVERMRALRADTKVKVRIKRDGKVKELELTTRPAYQFTFSRFGGGPGPVVVAPALPAMPALPDLPGGRDWLYVQALSDETEGMELAKLTPALGWYFGTDKGVLVLRASGNDAFRLKDGDVIVSIDGREPQSGAHATRILRSYQPGERITLKIVRQKRPMSLEVTLPEPTQHHQVHGPAVSDFEEGPLEQ